MGDLIKGFPSTMNDEWQLNLWKVIQYAAKVHGSTEVVSDRTLQGGQVHRLNYRLVYERVCAMANALKNLGVKPGDRIAILGWNDHRYYESFYSIPGIGSVLLTLNLRLHPDELVYILNHAGARALFVDDTLLTLAEELAKSYKFDFFVIMSDKPLAQISTNLSPVYGYEELIAQNPKTYDWEEIDEKSAAVAVYTTGTTGRPKGILWSHRASVLHGWGGGVAVALRPEVSDVHLPIAPFFHVQGWAAPIFVTIYGTKTVLPGRYTADSLVELMTKERVTTANGATIIFMQILEALRKMEPKPKLNVRAAVAASEPPVSLQKGLAEFGIRVIHTYGTTEFDVVLVNLPKPEIKALPEEQQFAHMSKQGFPIFGVEVKLVDPITGRELPWDGKSIGELYVRGAFVVKEYYNDPRTKEAFTPDKYWKTGDAGYIDELGYFKITDRIKDVIKSGGEWISSVDLENYLMSHPYVLEATVIGIPHPRWEERPLALVVLRNEYKDKPPQEIEKELREYLSKKFAKWQLPDKILFVDEILKTSVGKFDKKVLREQYKNLYMSST
ncbi:MAG: long-chain-fatty-acid--CoA ligase [Thermoproteota archaeon]